VTRRGAEAVVCDVSCDMVYSYVDEALEPEDAERFQAHLLECDACTERIQDAWVMNDATDRVIAARPRILLCR
jgi:anti-sigma factor RsiW